MLKINNFIFNIIGAGKSKLFNAFYWCFYDEIYKTDSGQSLKQFNFKNVFVIKKEGALEDLTEFNSYSKLEKII